MSDFLTAKADVVTIYVDQNTFVIDRQDLEKGFVYDKSNGSLVLRAWKSGDEIHVVHLFGHDVRWPNHVYIFAIPEGDCEITDPRETLKVHEYLSKGNGIPAVRVSNKAGKL